MELDGFQQYAEVDMPASDLPIDFNLSNSPIIQANMWAPYMKAYPWQKAVWQACWRPGAQVAMRTCNESGKSSFVVPILALSWAAAFPGSQTVITSASQDQINEQLWPAIRQMASNRRGWTVTKTKITAPSVDGVMPGSTIIIRVTKQGERFEGYHVRRFDDKEGRERYGPLLIIVDEGKSVSPQIYEAIERCNPTVEFRVSTTGDDSGDFYDSCMNKSGLWTTHEEFDGQDIEFVIPWTKCPHLVDDPKTYARKKAMLDGRGPNDPSVCSILLAKFFRGGLRMVFDEIDMKKAKEACAGLIPVMRGEKKGFCDFSGGGDELTFGVREGNFIHPIVAWNRTGNISPNTEAEKYIRLFRKHGLKPEDVSGDNGGLGALIISAMEDLNFPIERINRNQNARQSTQFVDRYAEMHWNYKEALLDGTLILPNDPVLFDQMRLRRYLMKNTEDNKIRIEPKEDARKQRREHSPDRLETVVGLVASMTRIKPEEVTGDTAPRCGTPKEYWARSYEENNKTGFATEWTDG